MPQNLLKKLFWKINLIKMMKILICELAFFENIVANILPDRVFPESIVLLFPFQVSTEEPLELY